MAASNRPHGRQRRRQRHHTEWRSDPSVFHVLTFKSHASKMMAYPLMSIVRIQWVANILSRYRLCEPCGSFDSSACQRPHSSVVSMIASAWQPRFPAIPHRGDPRG
jgi:hypothetical protein